MSSLQLHVLCLLRSSSFFTHGLDPTKSMFWEEDLSTSDVCGGGEDGVIFNKGHEEKGDKEGTAATMSALKLAATVAWSLLPREAEQRPQSSPRSWSSLAEDAAGAFVF